WRSLNCLEVDRSDLGDGHHALGVALETVRKDNALIRAPENGRVRRRHGGYDMIVMRPFGHHHLAIGGTHDLIIGMAGETGEGNRIHAPQAGDLGFLADALEAELARCFIEDTVDAEFWIDI